jgi:hypothetical protein
MTSGPLSPLLIDGLSARELLRKKVRTGKASFYLGLAFFSAIFLLFLFSALPRLSVNIPLAGLIGFIAGTYFWVTGALWSLVWALVVQLNVLIDDVAGWVQGVLTQITATLRTQFVSGVVIDLEIVERQIQTLVTDQTSKLIAADSAFLPLVNEWTPVVAREGLRFAVMRVAGSLWSGNQLTLDRLEREAARLSVAETAAKIRPWLRLVMGIVLVLGLVLAAIPLGIAYGIAALL